MPESPYPMITIEEALEIIRREIQALPAIAMPFNEALGLVLAEDVFADEPMPPFAAASVDGYAVVAADGSGPRQVIGDQTAFVYVADLGGDLQCLLVVLRRLGPVAEVKECTGEIVVRCSGAWQVVQLIVERDAFLAHLHCPGIVCIAKIDRALQIVGMGQRIACRVASGCAGGFGLGKLSSQLQAVLAPSERLGIVALAVIDACAHGIDVSGFDDLHAL